MFDHAVVSLTSREEKRDAIEQAIISARDAGTLTYTDIMLNPQELVTFAFEVLDAVRLDSNNVPQYGQGDKYDIGPVRLVSIDPDVRIKFGKWEYERIPGTSTTARNRKKKIIDFGLDHTFVDITDDLRMARYLLWHNGWPVRQFRSRSGGVGQIVEWKWFERKAQLADATDEYRELHATLKARIEASRPADKKPAQQGRSQEIRT